MFWGGGNYPSPLCCLPSETKVCSGREKQEESIPTFAKALKAAAAPTHAWRIYFITRSRSATPRWPCNHLVCFHIHSYEAVICPAHCEAGGCPLLLSPLGAPLACMSPLSLQTPTAPREGTRETQYYFFFHSKLIQS